LKIATFNVNGVNSRLPQLVRWLERESPDVACLQELKADDSAFPLRAVQEAGYGAIHHGQRSWNGVAILAKGLVPREIRRGLPGDPNDDHSRYLEAEIRGFTSLACICRMATRSQDRSSTTSCRGSRVSFATPKNCMGRPPR